MYFACGENTSASSGRCVFKKRRVLLRLQLRHEIFERKYTKIHPRRGLEQSALGATEDQLSDNLLGPGRSGLGVGGDDNVIVPKLEPIPAGRVADGVLNLAGLPRPRQGWV